MGLRGFFSRILPGDHKTLPAQDQNFANAVSELVGYPIKNIDFFKEAFTLRSSNAQTFHFNYERLEFLGDAVLGSIISSYIYDEFQGSDEGILTKMKSKIVSRKSLNNLGIKLNLTSFIINKGSDVTLSENIHGNLLEALIGAVYKDVDYRRCRTVVLNRLVTREMIAQLEQRILSYKGLLIEWAQKEKRKLQFETDEQHYPDKSIHFRCGIWLENELVAHAAESSKKKAEEKAAQRAYYALHKKENFNVQKPKYTT